MAKKAMHDEDDELESDLEDDASDSGQEEDGNDSDQDAAVDFSGCSAAHQQVRTSLENDVAAFLARGGQIQQIDDNVMADPPRKPQSNYGSRPI